MDHQRDGVDLMAGVSFMPRFMISAASEQSAQWNSADKNASVTLSNGDRDATGGVLVSVRGRLSRASGKYYYEVLVGTSASNFWCGFGTSGANISSYVGNSASSGGIASGGNAVNTWTKAQSGTFTISAGDVLGFAADVSTGYIWVAKNNTWQLSGDPAAGTSPWITGVASAIYPMCSPGSASARIGTKTAELTYSPPSGFSNWAAA